MNFESIDPDNLNLSDYEFIPEKRKELKKTLINLIQEGHDLIRRSEEKLRKDKLIKKISSKVDTSTESEVNDIIESVKSTEMVFIEIEPPDTDLDENMLVEYLDGYNEENVSTELPNDIKLEEIFSFERQLGDCSVFSNEEKEIDEILSKIRKTPHYTCNICKKKKYGLKVLNEHLYKKHPSIRKFQCEECRKIFFSQILLESHEKQKHPQMQCNLCENILFFKKMDYLNEHLKKFHNGKNNNFCRICKKEFKSGYILKAHQNTHGDYKSICKYCGKTFKYQNLENHYKIHKNDRCHKCDMCDSSFIQKSDLVIHTRLHSGERPFKCKICDENFIANTNLNKHMKNRHKDLYI